MSIRVIAITFSVLYATTMTRRWTVHVISINALALLIISTFHIMYRAMMIVEAT